MKKLTILLNEISKNKSISKNELDFAETRLEGAANITADAEEKGGLAELTFHHFKVKLPYYKKAASAQANFDTYLAEYGKLLADLNKNFNLPENIESGTFDQIKFQELIGKIEVLGELLINHYNENT
jgi:hypothetical protein